MKTCTHIALVCFVLSTSASVPAADERTSIAGKVIDGDSKPVADLDVHALFIQAPANGMRRSATAMTAADGSFEFTPAAAPAIVFVRTKDSANGCLLRVTDKQTDLRLQLAPLASVHGKLIDDAGSPLSGLDVVCSFAIPVSSGHSVGSNTGAKSAADGTFAILGLFVGQEYTLQQFNRGDPPLTDLKQITADRAGVLEVGEITRPGTHWLNGQVIDPLVIDPRRQAVGGALVICAYNSDGDIQPSLSPPITKSAADGAFKVRRADTAVIVEAITADRTMGGIGRAAADDADVTVRVGPIANATGRLVDRTGKPITVGSVWFSVRLPENWGPRSGFRHFGVGVGLLDSDGRFSVTGLVPGQEYMLEYASRADSQSGAWQTVGTFMPTKGAGFRLDDLVLRPREPMGGLPRPEGEELQRATQRQQKLFDFLKLAATGTDCKFVVQRKVGVNFDDAMPTSFAAYLAMRMPGLKQRDTAPDGVLVDCVDLKRDGLSEVLISGWQPKCAMFSRLKFQAGGPLAWGDKSSVMLGAELAKKLDKKVGDNVLLYGQQFDVVGIYESPLAEENAGAIMYLETLERLMDRAGEVSAFLLTGERPIDDEGLEALRQRIEAVQPGIDVSTVPARKSESSK